LNFSLCISFKQQLLYGTLGRQADVAALAHFERAGCTPYEAARAAWEQEGVHEGMDYQLTEQQEEWAEVWRCAPDAVASALGLSADDVDVELQREPS
jgi:hypothetical protein